MGVEGKSQVPWSEAPIPLEAPTIETVLQAYKSEFPEVFGPADQATAQAFWHTFISAYEDNHSEGGEDDHGPAHALRVALLALPLLKLIDESTEISEEEIRGISQLVLLGSLVHDVWVSDRDHGLVTWLAEPWIARDAVRALFPEADEQHEEFFQDLLEVIGRHPGPIKRKVSDVSRFSDPKRVLNSATRLSAIILALADTLDQVSPQRLAEGLNKKGGIVAMFVRMSAQAIIDDGASVIGRLVSAAIKRGRASGLKHWRWASRRLPKEYRSAVLSLVDKSLKIFDHLVKQARAKYSPEEAPAGAPALLENV